MMMVVAPLVFIAAFAAAVAVIAVTIAPQWRRMVRLARGQADASFAPLATLARAERHIAVRRWAAAPATAPQFRSCAAA